MNVAEAIQVINEKFGTEASTALITYLDDYREDKISILREENRSLILEVKGDLLEEIASVRIEIKDLRTELKGDIASIRAEISDLKIELKGDIASVRAEISEVRIDVAKAIQNQTRWMVSTMIATAAIIIASIKLL